jgi:hypothetical protein
MNGGQVKGRRLVSEAGYSEWTKPQMPIAGKTSYGFGWFLQDYKGLKVIQHGGNIDGFNSMVAMIPEKKLGFVMLTNVSASPMGGDLMTLIFNNLAGVADAPPALPAATGTGTPADASAAKDLIGQYAMPSGEASVDIREADGKVTFNIPGQPPYTVTPRAVKDTFSMLPLPETYQLKVKRGEDGKVVAVVVAQPEGEFEFKRSGSGEVKAPIAVDELREKVIAAMGGEANIRKITSRVTTVEIDLQNQGVRGTGTSWVKAGSRSAAETHLTALGKEIAQGWDYLDGSGGSQLWTFAPEDKYTGKRLADAKRSADLYTGVDWSQFKKITVQGIKKVGEEDAYQVRFEVNDGTDYTEYYSTKTFLLLKHEGVEVSSTSSQAIPFTTYYSDYRDVDGVVLPFKTISNSVSQGDVVTVVTSIKQNVPVDDQIFAPRKVN